ncbi:aspartate aminotransferase family protein [Sodalis sp. RH14]|uniref:aspartate aminotransferase family protein n=1 Tax=Sodalis sp. RH14 TaxID=3394329 RepID=UPI0039B56E87
MKTNMDGTILERYVNKHPNSQKHNHLALQKLPSGVSRDVVYTDPFPLCISEGHEGSVTDIDGICYVDVVMGNGALLYGHSNPEILKAVSTQIANGTHLGSCVEQEYLWAQMVCNLLPSAEQVRFTSTGSEATQLAIRLARAYTGRNKYIRFSGHYHGWHDGIAIGSNLTNKGADSAGIPKQIVELANIVDPRNLQQLQCALKDDAAAVILEPSGGKAGLVPLEPGFIQMLREETTRLGVILIFDEVVSGFRWSTGGIQQVINIQPDLTTLGKILGGGFSCGAVAGREDIMAQMAFHRDFPGAINNVRVHHGGTFSANPIVATAGLATLRSLDDGTVLKTLNQSSQRLRERLNTVLRKHGIAGKVYGEASVFHIQFEKKIEEKTISIGQGIYDALKMELANQGVLMRRFTGILSSVHTEENIECIVKGFDSAFNHLIEEHFLVPL